MSRASAFIARMGETCTVHTRTLLGGRGAPTYWPVPATDLTWTDTDDVSIFVDEVQTREVDSVKGGRVTEKRMKAFVGCGVTIAHMDLLTYHSEVFEVESVTTTEYLYGNVQYQRVILVRRSE